MNGDGAGARCWKEMTVAQKAPWITLGKQEGEQYARAKVRLDKKHAKLSKTAATLGPKKRAAVQAKATAKAMVVSKAKVKKVLKVKTPTPRSPKVPSAGKVKPTTTLYMLAAPMKQRGVAVARETGTIKKPEVKTVSKVRASDYLSACLPSCPLAGRLLGLYL